MFFRTLAAFLLLMSAASAQSAIPTFADSVTIVTGLTYQQLLPAGGSRKSLTIQNNNASDSCWLAIGPPIVAGNTTVSTVTINAVSLTALQASIALAPGQSYTRYYPYIPIDTILGTCTTTGDSLYVDVQ